MTALATALSEHEARRVTERIRAITVTVKDQLETLQTLLNEARDGEAWRVLGYASWTAYLADVMGEQPLRLPRDERQQIVGYLAGEGMSVRGIAAVTNSARNTVREDLRQVGQIDPPAPLADDFVTDQADLDAAPELPDEGAATPHDSGGAEPSEAEASLPPAPARSVTGLDGKQYTRPEPRPETKSRPGSAMSATEADQDRQQQEAQALARALVTLSAFQYPQARQRYRESWAAQPYSRGLGEPYYNPNTIRELARSLTTFANELEAA